MKKFGYKLITIGLWILVLCALGVPGLLCALLIKCIVSRLKKKGVIKTKVKTEENVEPSDS